MERITAAAIRIGPCVYTGPHHATIIHYVSRCTGMRPVTGEQGFLTDAGRFVDRREALDIATRAGQRAGHANDLLCGASLFSEDLWIVPDEVPERPRHDLIRFHKVRGYAEVAIRCAHGTVMRAWAGNLNEVLDPGSYYPPGGMDAVIQEPKS